LSPNIKAVFSFILKPFYEDEYQTPNEEDYKDIYIEEIPGESEDDFIYGKGDHHIRMGNRKEMLAKPAPVGTGGVDNVFDKDGRRMPESVEMPTIEEFKEDAVIERYGRSGGYGGRAGYEEGHPQSKYDSEGEKKDPYADSGHTVDGKSVTWGELWRWYETSGEYERD
jgi:hypothetical protein